MRMKLGRIDNVHELTKFVIGRENCAFRDTILALPYLTLLHLILPYLTLLYLILLSFPYLISHLTLSYVTMYYMHFFKPTWGHRI